MQLELSPVRAEEAREEFLLLFSLFFVFSERFALLRVFLLLVSIFVHLLCTSVVCVPAASAMRRKRKNERKILDKA